eukprot:600423-Amorphochlora_amoeboformis.AAC.1
MRHIVIHGVTGHAQGVTGRDTGRDTGCDTGRDQDISSASNWPEACLLASSVASTLRLSLRSLNFL